MINNIGGVTSSLVSLALDAAMQRHQLIAHNIANANTENFSAKRLSFEAYLTQFALMAADKGEDALLKREISALKSMLESGESIVETGAESVELDREMTQLAENVIRYRAILAANDKRGELIAMAVRGGRT